MQQAPPRSHWDHTHTDPAEGRRNRRGRGRASPEAHEELRGRSAAGDARVHYAGGIAPDLLPLTAHQHAPILMFWGGKDAHIPPEAYRAVADALSQAGKDHEQVVFSQADHGFNCDARASFHAGASKQAWALVEAFLHVALG
ncbi:MAG: dienelactone hydrolase family protein [Vulcanimicrobiaceae bacterium]